MQEAGKPSECVYGSSRRELSTPVPQEAKPSRLLDSFGIFLVIRWTNPSLLFSRLWRFAFVFKTVIHALFALW
jgi:hypothetical protein